MGGKAHVSIYGAVNAWKGVIDIGMERDDWHKMPDSLQPDTTFDLWCSASLDNEGIRFYANTELYWTVQFSNLHKTVRHFLPHAWIMLKGLNEYNILKEWPGPSVFPDHPPEFGPPRKRAK